MLAAPAVLDAVDRRIMAALQLDGRAPWHAVARAAGTSKSTVVRRFAALRDRGLVRVIGVVDVLRCGLGLPALVRLGCKPGTASEVASRVAARPEARFVAVVTGRSDCVAEVVVPDHAALETLLVDDASSAGVADIETLTVMRTFTSAHDWDTGLLEEESAHELRPHRAPVMDKPMLTAPSDRHDPLELALATALGGDGRLSIREPSVAVGTSESTVSRRLESLVTRGCLRFRTLVEPSLLGFSVESMIWLDVEPRHLEEVGLQLAKHPATKYLSATVGRYNLCGQVSLRQFSDLYGLTTDVIGGLPGLRSVDTTLMLRTLKRAWVPVPGNQSSAPQRKPVAP